MDNEQSFTIEAGDLASKLKDLQDPIEFLLRRTEQQRASMIGQLMGAYLEMTNLPPGEVELVQTPKEDGSISFRFKAVDPPSKVTVLMAQTEGGNYLPIRVLAPHIKRKAVDAIVKHINDSEDCPLISYHSHTVPLRGFSDDILEKESKTKSIGKGQGEDSPEGEPERREAESKAKG